MLAQSQSHLMLWRTTNRYSLNMIDRSSEKQSTMFSQTKSIKLHFTRCHRIICWGIRCMIPQLFAQTNVGEVANPVHFSQSTLAVDKEHVPLCAYPEPPRSYMFSFTPAWGGTPGSRGGSNGRPQRSWRWGGGYTSLRIPRMSVLQLAGWPCNAAGTRLVEDGAPPGKNDTYSQTLTERYSQQQWVVVHIHLHSVVWSGAWKHSRGKDSFHNNQRKQTKKSHLFFQHWIRSTTSRSFQIFLRNILDFFAIAKRIRSTNILLRLLFKNRMRFALSSINDKHTTRDSLTST